MTSLPSPDHFDLASPGFGKPKLQHTWPMSLLSNPIPARYRRRIRSKLHARQSPASSITAVETSISPYDTLRALRAHKWNVYDLQYILLGALAIFSWGLNPSSPLLKLAAALGFGGLLVIPLTRQFFFPFVPIGVWLVFFFNARYIPTEYRPHIWVRVLPALENIFYGANLSNILSAHKHVILDVLAWFPYGITHFGAPFVCSAIMFFFAAPGTTPTFARAFGYMNLIGVMIQIAFPCSPPWYENMYGLAPANYSMKGSPAGLARIDELFGFDMYTTTFTGSPVVFGAFPSLHSGNAVLEALFMSNCFPSLRPLFIAYAMWIWWATMYLSHHYAVDLVAGGFIAAITFYIAKVNFLPRRQPDKNVRWDYDYVERGDAPDSGHIGYEYGLTDMDPYGNRSSDEWTVGSSSSVFSGSGSPVQDAQNQWEGETLTSDGEKDAESKGVSIGRS